MSKIAIRVSNDIHAQVKAYADEHSLDLTEATERLLTTAFGRLAALARYAEQRAGKPAKKAKKKAAKKAPKKAAKKAPKKTSKANGKPAKKAAKKRVKKAKQDFAQTGVVEGATLP